MNKKTKSHSWAKKRFKITKKWKVLFKKAGNSHLLTNKGPSNKANPYKKVLATADAKKIKTLLPY